MQSLRERLGDPMGASPELTQAQVKSDQAKEKVRSLKQAVGEVMLKQLAQQAKTAASVAELTRSSGLGEFPSPTASTPDLSVGGQARTAANVRTVLRKHDQKMGKLDEELAAIEDSLQTAIDDEQHYHAALEAKAAAHIEQREAETVAYMRRMENDRLFQLARSFDSLVPSLQPPVPHSSALLVATNTNGATLGTESRESIAGASERTKTPEQEQPALPSDAKSAVVPTGVKSDADAAAFYHEAAKHGHAPAQLELGRMYLTGRGQFGALPKEAFRWIHKAADLQLPAAQLDLGLLYDRGVGCTASPEQAASCFRQAGEQGNSDGARLLAEKLMQGVGGEKREAGFWMHAAAKAGDVDA